MAVISLESNPSTRTGRFLWKRVRSVARSPRRHDFLVLGCLGLTFLACYWSTLEILVERWWNDPQYSHGFLVPFFAAYLLWYRSPMLATAEVHASGWGLAFMGVGMVLRLVSTILAIEALDAYSILPMLAGLVLLLGGKHYLRWAWPAIAFLAFMMPLPFQMEMALAQPLRRLATIVTTYILQTLGYPALAEGNVIQIDQVPLRVADACSGLGMLVTFFALATGLALVASDRLGEQFVIVVSAIPIAVVVNVMRITATAVVHQTMGSEAANLIMHDFAGWLMMPLALGVLFFELWYLRRLFIVESVPQMLPLGLRGLDGSKPDRDT